MVRYGQCFHRWSKNHRCIKCNTYDPTKNPEGIAKLGGVVDGEVSSLGQMPAVGQDGKMPSESNGRHDAGPRRRR